MKFFTSIFLLVAANCVVAQRHVVRPWAPEQACGAPNTPRMGDYSSAWASRLPDGGPEWLQVEFDREVEVAQVIVYESYNPGALTKIVAPQAGGAEAILWEGKTSPDATASEPNQLKLEPRSAIRARTLRLHLDTQRVSGWNEIDAVELVGRDGSRQWASHAVASSSYGDVLGLSLAAGRAAGLPWSAAQATGAPDTDGMGDLQTAWASSDPDGGPEWLSLDYSNAVEIAQINIYENLFPGAVSRIVALPSRGEEIVLWEGTESRETIVGRNAKVVVSSIEPVRTARAQRIRIELDTRRVPGWNEIDAVELVGSNGSRQWAATATASSSFGAPVVAVTRPAPAVQQSVQLLTERIAELERRLAGAEASVGKSPSHTRRGKGPNSRSWFPEQACGPPDTTQMGDFPTAWASRDCDSGREWIELTYAKNVNVAQLHIYETYNAGAITSVVAVAESGDITLWSGAAPRPAPTSRDPHVFVITPRVHVNTALIRIYLDSNLVAGWNEIDAVELVGRDGSRQWASEASASSSFGDQHILAGASARALPSHDLRRPIGDGSEIVAEFDRKMDNLEARLRTFALPPPRATQVRPSDPKIPRRRAEVNAWNSGPEQACGAPDTPRLGDFPTAWAPRMMDAGPEWLEVSFERAVEIDEVRVFESCGPGAITRVAAVTPAGMIALEPRTNSAHALLTPCNLTVHVSTPADRGTRARTVRIELDTKRVPGWNEIDAVELIGRDGSRHWAIEAAASSSYADPSPP